MDNNESSDVTERKHEVAGIFGRAAPTYDQVGPRFFSHFGRRLVTLAQIPSGANILDVATGRGAVLFSAAKVVGQQGHVTGIDLSEMMIQENGETIKRLDLQNVKLQRMDAEYLEFPDESFDCVLCSFAIFFFPQLDQALSEMRRVLKPNGQIAVTTWAGTRDEKWKWLKELIETYLPSESEPEQICDPQSTSKPIFNTLEGLDAILASAGFVNIRVFSESTEFVYADEGEWWSTLWSHGMRADLEDIEEKMGQDGLKRFQKDAFERVQIIRQPDGIHQLFSVLFGLASKPGGD